MNDKICPSRHFAVVGGILVFTRTTFQDQVEHTQQGIQWPTPTQDETGNPQNVTSEDGKSRTQDLSERHISCFNKKNIKDVNDTH